MKYDELVNNILQEQYFGGSPYERASGIKKQITFEEAPEVEEADLVTGDEVKAMQRALAAGIQDRRGGKKRSALQLVDPENLSPAGQEFLNKLHQSADLYKQGSAIGGQADLRSTAVDVEDEAFMHSFGRTELDYIGWDKGSGFSGAHLYRYPATGSGVEGIPHDKDGFRIEAMIEDEKEDHPGETLELFPLDQFEVINLFAKGAAEPILTKGRIVK